MAEHNITVQANVKESVSSQAATAASKAMHEFTSRTGSGAKLVSQFSFAMRGAMRSQYAFIGALGRLTGGGGIIAAFYSALKLCTSATQEWADNQKTALDLTQSIIQRRKGEWMQNFTKGDPRSASQEQADTVRRLTERELNEIDDMKYRRKQLEREIMNYKLPNGVWESIIDKGTGWFGGTSSKEKLQEMSEELSKLNADINAAESRVGKGQKWLLEREKRPETQIFSKNFMDNMSKMGLYMTSSFAAGGGNVQLEVMKEQKNLLQKIERNTAEGQSAVYSN